jgi:hypothetical protein
MRTAIIEDRPYGFANPDDMTAANGISAAASKP